MIVRTQVEKAARSFVDHTVERYGVVSALSRARMLTHDRVYRYGKPQWLPVPGMGIAWSSYSVHCLDRVLP